MAVTSAGNRLTSSRLALCAAGLAILVGGLALFFALAPPSFAPWTLNPSDPRVSLDDVEREVNRRYNVADVTTTTLTKMIASNEAILFDVRTPAEFDLGHLPGAVRVEPGMNAETFLALHADKLGTKPLVFYCAVGVRSSKLMTHLSTAIASRTTARVYNLRGGLFRWKADGLTVIKNGVVGQVVMIGQVHPFDGNWGQLLARTAP